MTKKTEWTLDKRRSAKVTVPDHHIICSGNQLLEEAYVHINMEWIGIDNFIVNLSNWLSDHVKRNGVPVIVEVLRTGLVDYAALLLREEKRYFPHQRLRAFLVGCFSCAGSMCVYKVTDQESGEHWSIESEVPYSRWRHGREHLSITASEMDRDDFGRNLYSRTVPRNLQLAMRRFGHEAAIMAGAMDYRH